MAAVEVTVPLLLPEHHDVLFCGVIKPFKVDRMTGYRLISQLELVHGSSALTKTMKVFMEDCKETRRFPSLAPVSKQLLNADFTQISNFLEGNLMMGVVIQSERVPKMAILSRLVEIREEGDRIVLYIAGMARLVSLALSSDYTEISLQVHQVDTTQKVHLQDHKMVKFISILKEFVEAYAECRKILDSGSNSLTLESLLFLASPTASILYNKIIEEPRAMSTLSSILKVVKSGDYSLDTALGIVDVITSIYPYSLEQKKAIAMTLDQLDRVKLFESLVLLATRSLEDLLDINPIVDSWNDFKSSSSKAQVILSGLKGLEYMSRDTATSNKNNRRLMLAKKPSQTTLVAKPDKLQEFMDKLDDLNMSPDGKLLILKDYERLKLTSSQSSDHQVLLAYLEIIMDIPWNVSSKMGQIDLIKCQKQLDDDHFGLDDVKERVLEYLAILNMHNRMKSNKKTKSPILLFTGPPGVGKTSVAKSIAHVMGREFQRISLGGLRDESEIKGHRRTYIGALPGLIIQALRKAKTNNPVILLDEIDKMSEGGVRGNGNPEGALLEVLDPEQNVNFKDHYIGFPVDISKITFLCTSNDCYRLSAPLLDRMEVIPINGYNFYEKLEILKRFILPKQISNNGLPQNSVKMDDNTILKVCMDYTREPGVRNLERTIALICRAKTLECSKLMDQALSSDSLPEDYNPNVSKNQIANYIGIPHHLAEELKIELDLSKRPGVVNGLSYNSDGSGSRLIFEILSMPSSSFNFVMTGKLGEVLRESGKIAVSLVKFNLNKNRLNKDNQTLLDALNSNEFHLHVPLGSVSKDGPSAGITMTIALLSAVLEKPVPSNIAMTGEITLRGVVLPIGGVNEKLLGAHLTKKIDKVLLPRLNRRDIIELYLKQNKDKTEVLLLEEQKFLQNGVKDIFGQPEQFVLDKYGITVIYVEDLNDALNLCWGGEYHLTSSITQEYHL